MLAWLCETSKHEQLVWIDMLLGRWEVNKHRIVWIDQVLEDVVTPHVLVDTKLDWVKPLDILDVIKHHLVTFAEFFN